MTGQFHGRGGLLPKARECKHAREQSIRCAFKEAQGVKFYPMSSVSSLSVEAARRHICAVYDIRICQYETSPACRFCKQPCVASRMLHGTHVAVCVDVYSLPLRTCFRTTVTVLAGLKCFCQRITRLPRAKRTGAAAPVYITSGRDPVFEASGGHATELLYDSVEFGDPLFRLVFPRTARGYVSCDVPEEWANYASLGTAV